MCQKAWHIDGLIKSNIKVEDIHELTTGISYYVRYKEEFPLTYLLAILSVISSLIVYKIYKIAERIGRSIATVT